MEDEDKDSPFLCPCCGKPFSDAVGTIQTAMLTRETGTTVHTWCVPLAEQGKFLSKPEITVSFAPAEARYMTKGEIRAAGIEVSEDPCAHCGRQIRDNEIPNLVDGKVVCSDCCPPAKSDAP